MGLETGTYIFDLNPANPSGTDPKAQGDDHIRLIKAAARNSFAGFPGAVVVTGVEAQGASADEFVVAVSPAPAAYSTSMLVVFKASHANTGAATVKINALSAKALKAVDGSALEAGDIEAGAVVGAFFDGTDFLLVTANDRAARAGDNYTGAHDFTAASSVTAPTVSAGDGSAKVATTAYVDAADALKAPLVSPALTGIPTAPTAAPGTNTAQVATTEFVQQQAFQAALPVQEGNAGRLLTTDGVGASWGYPIASQAEAQAGVASDRLMSPEGVTDATAWQLVGSATPTLSIGGGAVSFSSIPTIYKDLLVVIEWVGSSSPLSTGGVSLELGDATATYAPQVPIADDVMGNSACACGGIYIPNATVDHGVAFVSVGSGQQGAASPAVGYATPYAAVGWRVTGGVRAIRIAFSSPNGTGVVRLFGRK